MLGDFFDRIDKTIDLINLFARMERDPLLDGQFYVDVDDNVELT